MSLNQNNVQFSLDIPDAPSVEREVQLRHICKPFKKQLLKWVGNKQRFAHEIISYFPARYNTYYEPFLGSGAVLGTLAPRRGIGSDTFEPLIQIWQTLKSDPELLKTWYAERWHKMQAEGKVEAYEAIKASYNAAPNPEDFIFLTRSCYGGVVRFRQQDGYMSTPCGVHDPVPPESFSERVDIWRERLSHCDFLHSDYEDIMDRAGQGDIVYCDPPYSHSQAILYGAQKFSLENLLEKISACKKRGAFVALSIDGSKKSGNYICDLPIPEGLFARELAVNCGRSMLKRFQMEGQTLEHEVVTDRLLITH